MKLLSRYWYLFLLLVIVIVSQIILLEPHLKYGFSDVDWGFLSIYKTENPYSPSQFIEFLKRGGTLGGIYTHQIYYIGIQNDLFGLDFRSFQVTTHIFKTLAILSIFPLFLAISGSRLAAFIVTILFGFSYSAVGPMYTVVTSNDYSAIFALGIFVFLYWYVVKKNTGNLPILILSLLLLILTLFLSTERMYALPLYIALTEGFIIFQRRKLEKNTIKRILVLLLPPFLIFLAMPAVFLSFVSNHGVEIIQRISAGNWNLLLTPFIALGSIISPHDFTKYLGTPQMDNFWTFLDYFISGPLIILTLITTLTGIVLFNRAHIFIMQTLVLTTLFSIFVYITGSHFVDHEISLESIAQSIVGSYVLAIAIASFIFWLKSKERLLIGLFVGPFCAFLYILLTWIGAATSEVFAGTHRYLTIPALFMSFFLGNLFVLIVLRLFNLLRRFKYIRFLAVTPLLLLVIFININVKEIQAFFYSQLNNGFAAADKQMMRNQLNDYLNNLSSKEPSLFYFDFMEDNNKGYYYDNALLAGFQTWMLWHPSINFNKDLAPKIFWNNPDLLRASIQIKNGEKFIFYEKTIYNIDNLYAFKLKDKKVIDIKEQILSMLGI